MTNKRETKNNIMNPFHAHPSPKPITQFSLYTTEKPDKESVNGYDSFIASWLAYLQEPEWKVDQEVYIIGFNIPHIIRVIVNSKTVLLENGDRHDIKALSHFYPGQKIDPFKVSYVREVKIDERKEPHDMKTKYGVRKSSITVETFEWQPAPEPEKPTPGMSQMGGQDNDIEYEPEDEFAQRFKEWENDHDKWVTDLSEGTVQATILN